MANIFYQGAELGITSGTAHNAYARFERVQDIKVDYQIPRTPVPVIGRFKPLNEQPVINYTPVNLSVSYTKGNKDIERYLGLLNSTGVAVQIGQGTEVSDWGARNYIIYNAPLTSNTYAGQWEITSGILKSFTLNGSVGEPVKGSISVEGIDLRQSANTSARTIPTYSGYLIKPEGQSITGMDFTGLGYTGLTIQSFSFQVNFNHANTYRLGTKYPERRITEASATLQLSAFMEGASNTATSITGFDCGAPMAGQHILTLQPSCATGNNTLATVITMTSPYLVNHSLGVQVGNFTAVDLSFVCPLSIVPFECTGLDQGSNVTIT